MHEAQRQRPHKHEARRRQGPHKHEARRRQGPHLAPVQRDSELTDLGCALPLQRHQLLGAVVRGGGAADGGAPPGVGGGPGPRPPGGPQPRSACRWSLTHCMGGGGVRGPGLLSPSRLQPPYTALRQESLHSRTYQQHLAVCCIVLRYCVMYSGVTPGHGGANGDKCCSSKQGNSSALHSDAACTSEHISLPSRASYSDSPLVPRIADIKSLQCISGHVQPPCVVGLVCVLAHSLTSGRTLAQLLPCAWICD
jgi:hypothetical protein